MKILIALGLAAGLSLQICAQENEAGNWTTPIYWAAGNHGAGLKGKDASITTGPLPLVAMTPCRLVDTRPASGFTGAFGGPELGGTQPATRDIAVPFGSCGIPNTAKAYSLNIAVVPLEPLGYLTVWPTGLPRPLVSTLNALEGQVTANAAIVAAGSNGAISVYAPSATHLVIDINGYFTDALPGPAGPQGPQGFPGPAGPAGPQGPPGPAFCSCLGRVTLLGSLCGC